MKKTIFSLLIAIFVLGASVEVFSQDKSIAIGIGAGLTRGINEGKQDERTLGPLFGVYGLFNNGLGKNLTPEFSFSYYKNGTSDFGGFSQYSTTHMTPELRLRYYFPVEWKLKPYAFAGVGAMIFTVNEVPNNPNAEAKLDGISLSIPAGLGFTYPLNNKWGIDFNAYANMTLTDDLNPVWDDIKDGNWVARLGIHYTVLEIATDSDHDGLSDVDEAKLGTDPKNPDTDGDGLKDGQEVKKYKTNPLDADTDDGGINDGIEVKNGADPLNEDDDILSIPVGGKIIIKNIEFETAKATLTARSERILQNVLKAMTAANEMELLISGHTDDVGERDMNIQLSKDRAESVKNWLVARGISANRLSTRGAGPDEPIVPNTSDENRQRNRRCEFSRSK